MHARGREGLCDSRAATATVTRTCGAAAAPSWYVPHLTPARRERVDGSVALASGGTRTLSVSGDARRRSGVRRHVHAGAALVAAVDDSSPVPDDGGGDLRLCDRP